MTALRAGLVAVVLATLVPPALAAPPAPGPAEEATAAFTRITTPVSDSALPGALTIGVQAFDRSGLRSVTLYADGIRINTFACTGETCAGAFVWVTDTHLPAGAHTLFAVATNAEGATLQSAPITVLKLPPPEAARQN